MSLIDSFSATSSVSESKSTRVSSPRTNSDFGCFAVRVTPYKKTFDAFDNSAMARFDALSAIVRDPPYLAKPLAAVTLRAIYFQEGRSEPEYVQVVSIVFNDVNS